MGNEIWIPIIGMLSTAGVLVAFFYLSYKSKRSVQDTIRKSLEQGSELTPELLDRLGTSHSPRVKDLRRGIVLAAIGIAFGIMGLVNSDPETTEGLVSVGMFPLLVGMAFLLVWKLNRYND